jgi:hypothetical protein
MRRRTLVQVISSVLIIGSLAALSAQSVRDGFTGYWGALFAPAPTTQQLATQQLATTARQAQSQRPRSTDTLGRLRHWNSIAIDASGLDHTPVDQGDPRHFGEQLGPGRAARAMAIVHLAIYRAVSKIAERTSNESELDRLLDDEERRVAEGEGDAGEDGEGNDSSGPSMDAAIAQAAHDTMVALFPSQSAVMDGYMAEELNGMPREGRAKGQRIGRRAARAILARAARDGSGHTEPRIGIEFIASNEPGKWRQDPISQVPLALGAYWGQVKPFVMRSGSQFRAPAPPALNSAEYAVAYEEAKRLGGDGAHTQTSRNDEQTTIGTYWAYDGTPSLCAPPRLYNQVLMTIADQMGTTDVVELSRLLALANVAMSDAAIAIWESKFHYQLWRPVTAIREADAGTGPTRLGDGNDATVGDREFMPLGAPATNLVGPNFTPPFPTYPSGHAGIGGALFQILRRFYGTDDITFTFTSDEFNGETADNQGVIRPLTPRTFTSLSQAEEENGQSRIYLGIHWSFDKTEGIAQGRKVADYVFDNALR